jgi:hypothetical protein
MGRKRNWEHKMIKWVVRMGVGWNWLRIVSSDRLG